MVHSSETKPLEKSRSSYNYFLSAATAATLLDELPAGDADLVHRLAICKGSPMFVGGRGCQSDGRRQAFLLQCAFRLCFTMDIPCPSRRMVDFVRFD